MGVRFADELDIRDLPPPPSSFSTHSTPSPILPQPRSPMILRSDGLLMTAPTASVYDSRDTPVLQQTPVSTWALPPNYSMEEKPEPKMGRIQRLGESFLFITCLRTACLLLSVAAIFSCAFSAHWTEKAPVVFALIFSIVSGLVIAAALAVLFVWEMPRMNMAKRCLFTLIFALTSLTAGVLYCIGVSICSSYNQFGCFVTNQSPSLKVAAAFSFIAVVVAAIDCGLTFYFYKFDPMGREFTDVVTGDPNPAQQRPLPSIHTEV